jgi:hypothetical protein
VLFEMGALLLDERCNKVRFGYSFVTGGWGDESGAVTMA